jgi:integrase
MWPESSKCKDLRAAKAFFARRAEQLERSFRLRQSVDPGKVRVDELLDDLLESLDSEDTRKNYRQVLTAHVRPFFGHFLATDLSVEHCRAYRKFRRQKGIKDTTINRDLSKISQAFKLGIKRGKVHSMPVGGCDFRKKPETENIREVRLPDKFYAAFKDALHPALRCFFVVGYNTGRRKSQLLRTEWSQVDFDEKCIYYPPSKKNNRRVKAPFFGEMGRYLREQKAMRDKHYPNCPYVFFWFDYRFDKDGKRIVRFDRLWDEAVQGLGEKMKEEGREPIDLHIHDLRRSAHYQMRKAGVDGKTRRDIMGHRTGSMDDRYTIIDDEAVEDAVEKMQRFQTRRGLVSKLDTNAQIAALEAKILRLRAAQAGATTLPGSAGRSPDSP